MKPFATILLALVLAAPALAQQPHKPGFAPSITPPAARGGDACALGTAQQDLAFADVRARLYNKGNLFFDGGDPLYEVPKGSGITPIFASGVWVGGLVEGELRIAAATYAQFGQDYEFYPGPLDEAGTPPEDCAPYDRIWRVDVFDLAHYEATGVASVDMAEWPVHLGAPVVDGDGIPGNYNLEGGDRPLVYGHETAFWVMNDVAGPHLTTLSEPIGLEVRVSAFTSAETMLARSTVYRYELVYRGEAPLEDARFTLFVDPDLGNYEDDYIGSDTTRSMAFVYNADNYDEDNWSGYGTPPPALGIDFLTGAGVVGYFNGNADRTGNPSVASEYYNYMRGLWKDGLAMTEGGDGTGTSGEPTTFAYPGEVHPQPQYWSEICPTPNCATSNAPSDRRFHISTPAFSLNPGETQVIDLAILFAWGDDHLHSVAELKALSDAVQARYDADALFAPGAAASPPGSLATPQLLEPEDGAFIVNESVGLRWTVVPGAEQYRVEFADSPDFAVTHIAYTTEPSLGVGASVNEKSLTYWRVRAMAGLEHSHPSEIRSYRSYTYEYVPDGDAIVEIAHPAGDPCAGAPADPGCTKYGGNAVWLDPNSTSDYYVSTYPTPVLDGAGGLLLIFHHLIPPDDLEIRFSEACQTEGACLGVYGSPPNPGDQTIASVPFELWNVGDEDDPEDDLRLIPFIRANVPGEEHANWADTFTARQASVIDGIDSVAVTDQIYWMMPDRPDGYARFAEAALGFGGPGASYDPTADGDTENEGCARGGYYVDFCHMGATAFVALVQKMVFADLAGSGQTPPAGTVIRFITNDPLFTGTQDEAPSVPQAARLLAPYPNPFRASAAVPFEVTHAGPVRLAVYDVLGRRVGVLLDGELPAGRHEARLEGHGLAGGVYLVVLEAGGERQSRRLVLVR